MSHHIMSPFKDNVYHTFDTRRRLLKRLTPHSLHTVRVEIRNNLFSFHKIPYALTSKSMR